MKKMDKRKIMFWDDAGLWLHKKEKDTIEKIREDAIKLFEEYNEAIEAPDLMWISSYSVLRKMSLKNRFMMGMIHLISRVDALVKENLDKPQIMEETTNA
jgi:hypothetical protein